MCWLLGKLLTRLLTAAAEVWLLILASAVSSRVNSLPSSQHTQSTVRSQLSVEGFVPCR